MPVDAGKAVFSNDYAAGTYSAEITYLGDDNFNTAVDSTSFTVIEHNVTKKDTPIDIGVASVENNVTITVTVDSEATGLVEISIGDESIYLPVNNGKVTGEFSQANSCCLAEIMKSLPLTLETVISTQTQHPLNSQ